MPLKPSVQLHGISPEILVAYIEAIQVYAKYNYPCIITSCIDGKHMRSSKHYMGDAIDLRTKHIPALGTKRLIQKDIIAALTKNYDVILESIGKPNEHLHIEVDIKG